MPESEDQLFRVGRSQGSKLALNLEFAVDCTAHEHPGHFFDGLVPLVTPLLIEVFRSCGIDNFELFPATLVDGNGDASWGNYFAFNTLGLIDATCHEASEAIVLQAAEEGQPERVSYSRAVIDPAKVRGLLMFRDSRDPSLLILHDGILEKMSARTPIEGFCIEFERLETAKASIA